MAATSEDDPDDPTRALDDFVRRMRPVPPPAPPDLADLGHSLPSGPTPANPRGGVLRDGRRWSAADVEDVPVVELPRPPVPDTTAPPVTLPRVDLPPLPDADALAAGLRGVRAAAAAQQAPDTGLAWQPDPVALQLRPALPPRLLRHWQPGAWLAAVRQVCDGRTEVVAAAGGPVVESHPPLRLLLLWPSRADSGPPGRWPHSAWLLDPQAPPGAVDALRLLPDDARVWPLPDTGDIDWALGAELVLHHTAGLRPFQIDGLRAFIDAERAAAFARVNDGYRQAAPGGAVQPR